MPGQLRMPGQTLPISSPQRVQPFLVSPLILPFKMFYASFNSDVIFSSITFVKDVTLDDAMERISMERYRTLEVNQGELYYRSCRLKFQEIISHLLNNSLLYV